MFQGKNISLGEKIQEKKGFFSVFDKLKLLGIF
jgi:hypothetical protein